MTPATQRKVLLGVLCGGGALIGLDWWSRSAPDSIEAADSYQITSAGPVKAAELGDPVIDDRPAAKLRRLAEERPSLASGRPRDAFIPTAAFAPKLSPTQSEDLPMNLYVSGVMKFSNGGNAIINDKVVPLGGSISGYQLIALGENTVTVRRGKKAFLLYITRRSS